MSDLTKTTNIDSPTRGAAANTSRVRDASVGAERRGHRREGEVRSPISPSRESELLMAQVANLDLPPSSSLIDKTDNGQFDDSEDDDSKQQCMPHRTAQQQQLMASLLRSTLRPVEQGSTSAFSFLGMQQMNSPFSSKNPCPVADDGAALGIVTNTGERLIITLPKNVYVVDISANPAYYCRKKRADFDSSNPALVLHMRTRELAQAHLDVVTCARKDMEEEDQVRERQLLIARIEDTVKEVIREDAPTPLEPPGQEPICEENMEVPLTGQTDSELDLRNESATSTDPPRVKQTGFGLRSALTGVLDWRAVGRVITGESHKRFNPLKVVPNDAPMMITQDPPTEEQARKALETVTGDSTFLDRRSDGWTSRWRNIIESVIIKLRMIAKCNDLESVLLSITDFIVSHTNISMTELLTSSTMQLFATTKAEEDAVPWYKAFAANVRNFSKVAEGEAGKKIHYTTSLLLASGLLGNSKRIELNVSKLHLFAVSAHKERPTFTSLIDTVCDTVGFLIEGGYALLEGDGGAHLRFADRQANTYYKDYERVLEWYKRHRAGKLASCLHNGKKVTQDDLIRGLNTLAEESACMIKSHDRMVARGAERIRADVTRMITDYRTFKRSGMLRMRPYAVMATGGTAVRKSQFMEIVAFSILAMNGFPIANDSAITLAEDSKYWDNYNDHVSIIYMNDVYNTVPEKLQHSPHRNWLDINDNVHMTAPMAELEHKGAFDVNPYALVGSTNITGFGSNVMSNCPISILRRCDDDVLVKIKPEFATDDMVDNAKVSAHYDGVVPTIPDIWLLTVGHWIPAPGRPGKGLYAKRFHNGMALENVSIHEYLDYLKSASRAHFAHQRTIIEAPDAQERYAYCMTCDQFPPCACKAVTNGNVASVAANCTDTCVIDLSVPNFVSSSATGLAVNPSNTSNVTNVASGVIFGAMNALLTQNYVTRCVRSLARATHKTILMNTPMYFKDWWFYRRLLENNEYYAPVLIFRNFIWCLSVMFQCYAFLKLCSGEWTKGHKWYFYFLGPLPELVGLDSCPLPPLYLTHVISYLFYFGWAIGLQLLYGVTHDAHINIWWEVNGKEKAEVEMFWRETPARARMRLILEGCALVGISYAIYRGMDSFKGIFSMKTLGLFEPSTPEEKEAKEKVTDKHDRANPEDLNRPVAVAEETATATHEQVISVVKRNLVHIERVDNHPTPNGIFVDTNLLLVPYHTFHNESEIKVRIFRSTKIGASFTTLLSTGSGVRLVHDGKALDAILLWVPNGGDFKNILPRFSNQVQWGAQTPCTMLVHVKDEVKTHSGVGGTSVHESIHSDSRAPSFCATTDVVVKNGWCGSPFLTAKNNAEILGFVVAGVDAFKATTFANIPRKAVEVAKDGLCQIPGVIKPATKAAFPLEVNGVKLLASDQVHYKSQVCEPSSTVYTVAYGSCPRVTTNKPIMGLSHISKKLAKCGFPNKWKSPTSTESPYKKSLRTIRSADVHFSPRAVQYAVQDYLAPLAARIRMGDWPNDVGILSDEAIINGTAGKRFVNHINFNSSIGPPLSGKKWKYIEGEPGEYALTSELQAEMTRVENVLAEGKRAYCPSKACLKMNEARKAEKDGIRVFQAMNISLNLLMRKYFLNLARFLSFHPLLSECGVGMNATGKDWEETMLRVKLFRNWIGGDYGNYDLKLPTSITMGGFSVLISLAKHSGSYSERDIRVMESLAYEICHPILMYDGTVLQLCGLHLSGHNLTAHLGSIYNALMMRCAFYDLHKGVPPVFRSTVAMITYGDDMLGTVHDSVKEVFNHKTYAKYLSERGMVFTMPQKNATPKEFLDEEDRDFLKRRSFHHPDIDTMIGKLDLDSMLKSLHMTDTTSDLIPEAAAGATIDSFMYEIYFHGRASYEKWQRILSKVASDTQCEGYARLLKIPYDCRTERWKKAYAPEGSQDDYNDLFAHPKSEEFVTKGLEETSVKHAHEQYLQSDSAEKIEARNALFYDMKEGNHVDLCGDVVPYRPGMHPKDHMGESGKNAVLVATIPWEINDESKAWTVNPWKAYNSLPEVARKLANYSRLQMSLKVTCTITGGAAYAGEVYVGYVYHPTPRVYDWLNVDPSNVNEWIATPSERDVMNYTQNPGMTLSACGMRGGSMDLPFAFHKDWASIPDREIEELGVLVITPLSALRMENVLTGSVVISVYVQPIELAPTVMTRALSDVPLRTESEWKEKPFSKTAGVLQKVAKLLAFVPYAGGIQRATELASGALSEVGHYTGYSGPRQTVLSSAFTPSAFLNSTVVNVPRPLNPLVCDDKQGLAITPDKLGFGKVMEFTRAYIESQWTMVADVNWPKDAGVGDVLFSAFNSPCQFERLQGGDKKIHYSASAHIAWLFEYSHSITEWKAVVVSNDKQHGALSWFYDPNVVPVGPIGPANKSTGKLLSTGKEYLFAPNWNVTHGLAKPIFPSSALRRTYEPGPNLDPTRSVQNDQHNGFISLCVNTPLNDGGGLGNQNIKIQIWQRTRPGGFYLGPSSRWTRLLSFFPPTGEEESIEDVPELMAQNYGDVHESSATGAPHREGESLVEVGSTDDSYVQNLVKIYGGELPPDLKSLCQRPEYYMTASIRPEQAFYVPIYPPEFGYDITAPTTTAAGDDYWYCHMLTYQYLTSPFTYVSGGMCMDFTVLHGGYTASNNTVTATELRENIAALPPTLTATRISGQHAWFNNIELSPTTSDVNTRGYYSRDDVAFRGLGRPKGTSASVSTPLAINNTLSVEVPFYSNHKALQWGDHKPLDAMRRSVANGVQLFMSPTFVGSQLDEHFDVEIRYSCGEDFFAYGWRGTQPVYLKTRPPPTNNYTNF